MTPRRRLRSLDDSALGAFDGKKAQSPTLRRVSDTADSAFTPSFQLKVLLPLGLGSCVVAALLGIYYVSLGAAGFGWSVIGVSLLGAVRMLCLRRVFVRRQREGSAS